MRFPALFLLTLALPLAHNTTVQAEDIQARQQHIESIYVAADGTGVLDLVQGHACAWQSHFSNYVRFRDQAAYFDERGTVLGIVERDAAFDF